MHNHFITKCKICGIVISQCRCMSKDKTEILEVCDDCLKENLLKEYLKHQNESKEIK